MVNQYVYVRDGLRDNRAGLTYEAAAPVQRHLRPSPQLLLGPVPRRFGEWHYGDREAPAVGLYRLQNVTLQADRVLTQTGQVICIEQNGLHPQTIEQADTRRCSERTLRLDDEVVLLCGPAYQMYGHWLIDFLPRLHVLTHLGLPLDQLTYLLPHNIMPFARTWLRLLGIGDAQIRSYDTVTETCEIASALIPTAFRGNGRANTLLATAAGAFKMAIMGEAAPAAAVRRLFVSRRQWSNASRTLLNVEAVERQMEAAGFEVVFPEELSIDQQVRLFAEAGMLVGEYGSGLHNSIFCPAGAVVIAFRGTEGHPGFLQSGLCEALGQDIGYVFCETQAGGGPQRFVAADEDLALLRSLLANFQTVESGR